ncbi:hypothetical protein KIW84_061768 [Lathyrus oleraceus]|uniref:Uncharacterized protein n=1 Tax=Pisum sativum TaxID=3888 RepID=A0A9D4W5W7_PEA|nr:hypothetical protein KIW84_061768 [Pisum sativum]
MTKEVDFVIGKNFNGHTLKNTSLITNVVNPSKLLDSTYVSSRRILTNDYPLFSKEESKEAMEHYNDNCLAKGCPQVEISYDELLKHPVDVYSQKRKRKPISSGERPFGSSRTPTKVIRTYGLSILRDTMRPGVEYARYETSRFSKVAPFGNHDESSNLNAHTMVNNARFGNEGFRDLVDHDDTCNPTPRSLMP